MTEETTPSAANAPAANVATPPTLAVTPETLAVDGNNETFSLEEAKKLRKEAQTLRTRLKSYEDAEAAKQLAALSEVEKATKRTAELEQKLEQEHKQHVNALVKLAAHSKGIIDPDIAALAIAESLEYGDDGLPTNLDKALDDLLKNKPYLKAATADPATTAAQTAAAVNRTNPALPAMNPGRSQFQAPGLNPQGRRPKLSDLL